MEVDEDVETIAKNSVWHGLGTVAFKLSSFVFTILIANYVSQDDVGAFYLALSIGGFIIIFAELGFTQVIGRYVPFYLGKGDKKSAMELVRSAVYTSLVLAVVVAAIVASTGIVPAIFANPALASLLPWIAAYIVVYQCFNLVAAISVGFKNLKDNAVSSNIQNISKLVIVIALVTLGIRDASALMAASILSFAIGFIWLFGKVKGRVLQAAAGVGFTWNPLKVPSIILQTRQDIWKFGLTMVFAMSLVSLITYTDRLFLGLLLQEGVNAQIAVYSIATGLAGLVSIFAASIMAIFLPVISEIHGRADSSKIRAASQTALRWVLFSSVPIAAFLAAFSSPMLKLLYGAEYEPGYLALSLFSVGMLATMAGVVQRTILAATRLLRQELLIGIFGLLLNVLLNYLLIPPYGINGAALGSAISFIAMAFLYQRATRKIAGPFPTKALLNILAGMGMFLALCFLNSSAYQALAGVLSPPDGTIASLVLNKALLLGGLSMFFIAGAIVYLLLINLMRLFEREDAEVFGRIAARAGLPLWLQKLAARVLFWNQKEIR